MSFRKFVGLAAIGGLLYAHKRRGGDFTVASFKQSWNDLVDGAKMKAMDARAAAESKLHETAERVADATDRTIEADDAQTGYSTSGYSYKGTGGGNDFRR